MVLRNYKSYLGDDLLSNVRISQKNIPKLDQTLKPNAITLSFDTLAIKILIILEIH